MESMIQKASNIFLRKKSILY